MVAELEAGVSGEEVVVVTVDRHDGFKLGNYAESQAKVDEAKKDLAAMLEAPENQDHSSMEVEEMVKQLGIEPSEAQRTKLQELRSAKRARMENPAETFEAPPGLGTEAPQGQQGTEQDGQQGSQNARAGISEEGPRSRMRVRPCAGVEVAFPLLIARTQAIQAKRGHLALSQRTGASLQSEERATRRGPLIPASSFALAAAARALTHPSPNWSGVRVVWIWVFV